MKKIIVIAVIAVLTAISFALSAVAYAGVAAWNNTVTKPALYENVNETEMPTETLIHGGYTAEISYNNLLLKDGGILRNLQFYIDSGKLTEGATLAVKTQRLQSAAKKLSDIKDLYESAGFTVNTSENYVEVSVEYYESYTDMYLAYGINGYESNADETEAETGWFFNKYHRTDTTVFSALASANSGSLASYIVESADILKTVEGMTDNDIAYIYNYGTKYSKFTINSDADNIYKSSELGITIHKFVMDKDHLNRQITFSQTSPNTITWYAITIMLTAVLAGIFIAIAIIDTKKKKRFTEEK